MDEDYSLCSTPLVPLLLPLVVPICILPPPVFCIEHVVYCVFPLVSHIQHLLFFDYMRIYYIMNCEYLLNCAITSVGMVHTNVAHEVMALTFYYRR
jgi:hypothetical protein